MRWGMISHLVFLKFGSINNPLISPGKLRFVKSLNGMSFLPNIEIAPPFWFLSSLKVSENSSVTNLVGGKVLPSFVSGRTRISIFFVMRNFKWSNLPGGGFKFKWSTNRVISTLHHHFAHYLTEFSLSRTNLL